MECDVQSCFPLTISVSNSIMQGVRQSSLSSERTWPTPSSMVKKRRRRNRFVLGRKGVTGSTSISKCEHGLGAEKLMINVYLYLLLNIGFEPKLLTLGILITAM